MTTITSSENGEPLEGATSDGIAPVGFREAFMIWLKIGLLSFGGPAGQIATMHRILVEEKRWIGEGRFLHALNFCMLLPGPEAQQLAVYVGWLLHRTAGGLVAGLLFVIPGPLSSCCSVSYTRSIRTRLICRPGSSASRRPCWRSCSRPCCGSAGELSPDRRSGLSPRSPSSPSSSSTFRFRQSSSARRSSA